VKQAMKNAPPLLLAALLGGCTTAGLVPNEPTSAASNPDFGAWGSSVSQEKPLYAWDGGVVEPSAQPASQPQRGAPADPVHGVQPTGSGRMYILELYQKAIDERDALEVETSALTAALERSQADLEAARATAAELDAEVLELEARVDVLGSENAELADRLITAQIRRLEAEKLLLEAKLEWHRAEQAARADEPAEGDAAGERAAAGTEPSGSGS